MRSESQGRRYWRSCANTFVVSPLVAVFFEVRFGGRGIAGNVLLGEIYAMACSEPPVRQFSKKKQQTCRPWRQKRSLKSVYVGVTFSLASVGDFFSDAVPERFSCRRFHAFFLILQDGLPISGVLAREVRQFLLAISRDVF